MHQISVFSKAVCAALKGASQDEAVSFSLEPKTKLVNRMWMDWMWIFMQFSVEADDQSPSCPSAF